MPAWDEWRASGARGARTIVAILDRRAARRRRSPTGSNPFHLPQESTLYRKSLPDDLSQGGASFLSSGGGIRTRDLRVMSPTSYLTAPPRGGPMRLVKVCVSVNAMAELTVYEKRTCTTCRKLAVLLEERGVDFDRVD